MSHCIRIAQVLNTMENGGVEAMVMNYYRNIDKNKIQFDFYCNEKSPIPYEKEIIQMGGKIFKTPTIIHLFKYIRYLYVNFNKQKL